MKVTVLYTRKNSIYNKLGTDNWDEERDARKWPGGNAVIAHPPCRGWGDHSHKSKATWEEKLMAIEAIKQIRDNGGILEHPRNSKLWKVLKLPKGTEIDKYGGWSLSINQNWFGHRAEKKTLLYIVGIKPGEIPEYPIKLGRGTNTIENMGKTERETTPIEMAKWLIKAAMWINNKKYS